MANIKPLDVSAEKWNRRASVAGPDYERGIDNPRRGWAAAAKAGSENYKTAIQQSIQEGRFGKGIDAAGDQKWQSASKAKGPSRFAEGVSLARDEWQKGFAPIQQAISSLQLPPRAPRGSAANLERVKAVTQATRAASLKR